MTAKPIPSPIEVRLLQQIDEFTAAVHLQQEIWGYADVDLLPLRLFVVASKVGGHSLGAYDGSRMIGFCIAIPGIRQDRLAGLHSHMLGVCPEYRDRGIGRLLKLAQRQEARAQGVQVIDWTFDPLELKNAFFNIVRLGAIVRGFLPNFYGTSSSHLHGGLPTDRLVAEWFLEGERGDPQIKARVTLPANIGALRVSAPETARAEQRRIAEELERYFAAGLAVVGFEQSLHEATYLVGTWESL